MADLGEENKVNGVFGGVEFNNNAENIENAGTIRNENLPVKKDFGIVSKHSGYKTSIGIKNKSRINTISTKS